jgi:sterol desaturase/sphingolipid hydroxylase (fatty acid hydroxylase superfamily)
METLLVSMQQVGKLALEQLPWVVGLAALFTVLSFFRTQACNPGKVWWRNKGLLTDLNYCFILPIFLPYLKISMVIVLVLLTSGDLGEKSIETFLSHGHGPLAGLPFWAQCVIYVLGYDFLLYWSHRLFHTPRFWHFHAVHHSPEDLDWTATYRFHPVNSLLGASLASIIMLKLGIAPEVAMVFVAFDIITGAWVHANLNWTLGPLRYVFATPVFHRWHHGPPDKGGESNFAPTFAFWDVMFGTFYMPEGQLPDEYGVDDPNFPKDFIGQLIYPFKTFFASFRGAAVGRPDKLPPSAQV